MTYKMYKGGASYTPESAKVLRYAGLLVPIILVVYGLLVKFGYFKSPMPFNDVGFFIISFWFLYVSIVQFLSPSRTKTESALRLICYHLLGAAFLVFISGISNPLASLWILLMIASNIYFGRNGLNLSVLWFAIVVLVDVAFWFGHSIEAAAYNLLTLVAVIMGGLVIMSVSKAQGSGKDKQAKDSKEQELLQKDRILTIVNNLSDAILSTDGDGTIKVYNAASLSLLDTNDSLSGKNIDDVLKLKDKDGKKVRWIDELKNTDQTVVRDDLIKQIDEDEQIRLEATYSPIRSSFSRSKHGETHDGHIIILRDITKTKSLEEEKDEFISVVSHELRTPITVAEGTISNVQVMMEHGDATQDMLKDAVDMAHDQVVFLSRMVNDLSTLSRAERGVSDKPEDIDLNELAHKFYEEYGPQATDKGLRFDLDLGATLGKVFASRLYLEEVLQNFITNSIKYTKEGTITLSIKQKMGEVRFAVKDTGIGISKSDQKRIFEKFYRSEDYRTRETSGNGLGLYITKKLAHKLNIDIELESRLNHGSTFSFKMPVSNSEKTVSPTKAKDPEPAKTKHAPKKKKVKITTA